MGQSPLHDDTFRIWRQLYVLALRIKDGVVNIGSEDDLITHLSSYLICNNLFWLRKRDDGNSEAEKYKG